MSQTPLPGQSEESAIVWDGSHKAMGEILDMGVRCIDYDPPQEAVFYFNNLQWGVSKCKMPLGTRLWSKDGADILFHHDYLREIKYLPVPYYATFPL